MNYYNEFDAKAAAWLCALISEGLIPVGHVDTRSISDVSPDDLKGYTQCHFFAGIGGWSYALQLAGWPEDRPVWTGSCPCQPWSDAGLGLGWRDPRHLWPAFRRLINRCHPPVVFGEQVASKLGRQWLSGVRADLETMGYVAGGADLCAAGVGAPHIRQRLFWVGYSQQQGLEGRPGHEPDRDQPGRELQEQVRPASQASSTCGVAHTSLPEEERLGEQRLHVSGQAAWGRFVLIPCADGKARRIEPGLAPLVNGVPSRLVPSGDPCCEDAAKNTSEARLMRLRGYGNGIVPQLAATFITAFNEVEHANKR